MMVLRVGSSYFNSALASVNKNPWRRYLGASELGLLYFLGLRVGDIVNSTWRAFKKINEQWWFFVRGKGGKLAKIPVNNQLLKIIIDYRVHHDLTVYPNEEDNHPLVFSLQSQVVKTIGERQINNIIKVLAEKTAERFPEQIAKQKKLKKLSPHWFRHQSASRQARLGVPMEHIRENMRHQNQQTTLIYMHSDDEERAVNLEKLTW